MSEVITKDMPEPKEYGPYLIATNEGKPLFIAHHRRSGPSTSWSDIEMEECSWYKLRAVAGGYTVEGGCTIESFAAHDARIRREALELSNEEACAALDGIAEFMDDDPEPMDDGLPIEMAQAAFAAVAKRREASDVRA